MSAEPAEHMAEANGRCRWRHRLAGDDQPILEAMPVETRHRSPHCAAVGQASSQSPDATNRLPARSVHSLADLNRWWATLDRSPGAKAFLVIVAGVRAGREYALAVAAAFVRRIVLRALLHRASDGAARAASNRPTPKPSGLRRRQAPQTSDHATSVAQPHANGSLCQAFDPSRRRTQYFLDCRHVDCVGTGDRRQA